MTSAAEGLRDPVDPARDHIRGPDDARVTLVQYGDFECPYCTEAHPELREALRRLGDGGVRFVFRHFPITDQHPRAQEAAEAAEAAAAQGRFWEMHDRIYERGPKRLARDDLLEDARALGLDDRRMAVELDDRVHRRRVEADAESGRASGVTGTPAFFLDGERYRGFYDAETLTEVLREALASRR
jgi:protein-disulfide isomerase